MLWQSNDSRIVNWSVPFPLVYRYSRTHQTKQSIWIEMFIWEFFNARYNMLFQVKAQHMSSCKKLLISLAKGYQYVSAIFLYQFTVNNKWFKNGHFNLHSERYFRNQRIESTISVEPNSKKIKNSWQLNCNRIAAIATPLSHYINSKSMHVFLHGTRAGKVAPILAKNQRLARAFIT